MSEQQLQLRKPQTQLVDLPVTEPEQPALVHQTELFIYGPPRGTMKPSESPSDMRPCGCVVPDPPCLPTTVWYEIVDECDPKKWYRVGVYDSSPLKAEELVELANGQGADFGAVMLHDRVLDWTEICLPAPVRYIGCKTTTDPNNWPLLWQALRDFRNQPAQRHTQLIYRFRCLAPDPSMLTHEYVE